MKLTPAQKEARHPKHLPRHYYPGYVFIPKNGYFQARKIGLTATRVHSDPRFHKTRLLAKEFARMGTYAKLIREAFYIATGIKCSKQKLHGLLNRALQHDATHICGSRKLLEGNLGLLEGFNFNPKECLEHTCTLECDMFYRPAQQQIGVSIPSFVPQYFICPPAGITYCRIFLVTATFNLEQCTYTFTTSRTSIIPVKRLHIPATELATQYVTGPGMLNITALGLVWYTRKKDNGGLMPSLASGSLRVISLC